MPNLDLDSLQVTRYSVTVIGGIGRYTSRRTQLMNPEAFLPLAKSMLADRYAAAERYRLFRRHRR